MSKDNSAGDGIDLGLTQTDDSIVISIPYIRIHAFCISETTASVLQGVASDRRLARANTEVYMGDISVAMEYYNSSSTPDVMILEFEGDRAKVREDLIKLADVCDEKVKVILIGPVNDVVFYREVIDMGVSEYIVGPIAIMQFIQIIGNLYKDGTVTLGRVIAFIGAKGGVGSSTISHNCAWIIAKMLSSKVIIADMDLPFGTVALNFNQEARQGVGEALAFPDRLDQTLLDRLLIKYDKDISLLGTSWSLAKRCEFNVSAYVHLIDILRKLSPFTILDIPHMWSDWIKAVLLSSDDVVIVVEPDLPNVRNAKSLLDLVKSNRPNDRVPHLVFNKVKMKDRPEITAEEFSKVLDVHSSFSIPFDPLSFCTAANDGKVFVDQYRTSPAFSEFIDIARVVTGRSHITKKADVGVMSQFWNNLGFSKK